MSSPEHAAMKRAVVDGEADDARQLAHDLVRSGGDILQAVEQGFAAGIREVGTLWEEGEYFLPELVQGAEAMKAAMQVLHPALVAQQGAAEPKGKVVIGTVHGDLHDIGKTLVATLLEANDFQVHDLGNDVPVEAFLARAQEVGADIVAASALLTTTMPVQQALVQAVSQAGTAGRMRVLVGGSPTTPAWAEQIGATFAENAQRAVEVAERMLA